MQGNALLYNPGKFMITQVQFAGETPNQKVKASTNEQFLLISMVLLQIENTAEFSSSCFILKDNEGKEYENPGAWGEIEIMGSKSHFETTESATVFIRKKGEILNLIFEVPKSLNTELVSLIYSDHCIEDQNSGDNKPTNLNPENYTIESIKLFEMGEDRPNKEDRYYSSSFDKEFTRFIGVEINFINQLYEKEYQEYPIEFIWYDTDGVVEGSQEGTLQMKKEWKTSYYNTNGWGWKDPGKWAVGKYKVDVLIDGRKVSEKSFYIREKQYEVENINVFGYKQDKPEKKDRTYPGVFNSDSIRYLGVEINFNNLIHEKEDQEHDLMLKWYDTENEYQGKQEGKVSIKADWSTAYYTSNGWGFSDLGMWAPGNYTVEAYIDNNLVGNEKLEIVKLIPVKFIVEPLGSRKVIQVSFAAMSSGYQNTFTPVFDKSNSGIICTRDEDVIVLDLVSKEINPGRSIMHNGDFIVEVYEEMRTFGTTRYAMIKNSDQTGFKMYGFQRKGTGEKLIGISIAEPSVIYAKESENDGTSIIEIKWENITHDDGTVQRAQIIRLAKPGTEWTVQLGNKIVEISDEGQKQIGWASWRTITLPDQSRQTILMTKAMDPNARWIGRFDGKLYETD